jgi:hypothetical protein
MGIEETIISQASKNNCCDSLIIHRKAINKAIKGRKFANPKKASPGRWAKPEVITNQILKIPQLQVKGCLKRYVDSRFQILIKAKP